MPIVKVPDVGLVKFPDSMSDEQIKTAIERDIYEKNKPTLKSSIPEPGEQMPVFTSAPPSIAQAFPAKESQAQANIDAKTPELSAEEAEQMVMSPQGTIPNPVPESWPITRGVVNVAKAIPEMATAPAAPLIATAQVVPGLNVVVDSVLGASMVKAGAQMAGEASVTGDREQMTEGVLTGLLGGAALGGTLARPQVAPAIANEVAARRVGKPDLAAADLAAREAAKPLPIEQIKQQAPLTAAVVEKSIETSEKAKPVDVAAEPQVGEAGTISKPAPASEPGSVPVETATEAPKPQEVAGQAEPSTAPEYWVKVKSRTKGKEEIKRLGPFSDIDVAENVVKQSQGEKGYVDSIITETITPSADTLIGKNSAGENLYQRANGQVYRLRFDRKDRVNGYPDFGGDLAAVATEAPKPKEEVTPVEAQPQKEGVQEVAPKPAPEPAPAIEGMGGAVPSEFQPAMRTATGIKNAAVEAARAERGLPPIMAPARESHPLVWDRTMARIDREPGWQDALIDEIKKKPHNLSPDEILALDHRYVDLQNEYAKATREGKQAYDDGRMEDVAAATERTAFWEAKLTELEEIARSTGAEWGRSGVMRQRLMREDFSLEAMERKMRAAKGFKPLTEAERAEIATKHAELERVNKGLEEKVAEKDRLLAEEQMARSMAEMKAAAALEAGKIPPAIKRIVDIVRTEIKRGADESRKFLAGAQFTLSPEVLYHLSRVGADNLLEIGEAGAKWATKMVTDLGERVRPHLDAILEAAQKLIDSTATKHSGGDKKKAKEASTAIRSNDTPTVKQGKAKAEIKSKVEAGDMELKPLIRKLARAFVEEGVSDRNALVDKVHEVVAEVAPEWSRRQTKDAISGYGEVSLLSKDEVDVRLRDLKGQLQQEAKLEDMAAGLAPKKTGPERRTPSDEERALIKQVNEAKKRGGFEVTDPETQLRSALQALKTRLENQITDLTREIESGQRTVKQRTSVIPDEEAKALMARRDALREQHEAIFGKRELTDEQRVKMAIAAVEKSIAEYERRISARDLNPLKRVSKTPQTPELVAAKQKREALKAELQELRDLANPKKTPAELALSNWKARAKRQIADLEERLATGNVAKKTKREVQLDSEALDLEHKREKLKIDYHRMVIEKKLAEQTVPQRLFRNITEVANLWRALRTSIDFSAVLNQGKFIVAIHPIRAAKALPDMFRAFTSEKEAFRADKEILKRKNYPLYKKSGLYLAEHGMSLNKMEEAYMSRWADKVIGVAGSSRAYTTFLNRLRADSFDAMAATLGHNGILTQAEASTIANYINKATGRGSIGIGERVGVGMNTLFFAPRFVASRFQMALGQPLYHGILTEGRGFMKDSMRARKLIAMEYAKLFGAYATVYALARAAGFDVGTDPKSTDFGKIIIGDTRIDPLAGVSQAWVLMTRTATRKSTTATGRTVPLTGKVPLSQQDLVDVWVTFSRSKLAPVPGAITDFLMQSDVTGEPLPFDDPLELLFRYTGPISLQDIKGNMEELGIPAGVATTILSLFGERIKTYEKRK